MKMKNEIQLYHNKQIEVEKQICNKLYILICGQLSEAAHKIWHAHPVWFINENPIVGYSKLKGGIRLMFWSGASFEERELQLGSGKFKDASKTFTNIDEIIEEDIIRWLQKSKEIQWDYKNVVRRKGVLERLK